MEKHDTGGASADDAAPLLPGFDPIHWPARPAAVAAPEACGRIDTQAIVLGGEIKAEGDVPGDPPPEDVGPVVLEVPAALGAGWTRVLARDVIVLAGRVLAIGQSDAARRWVALLARPPSVLFDIEAIRRMVVVMERQAAARSGSLPPAPPAMQYRDLGEVRAITGGGATISHRFMPAIVASAVLDGINTRLRALAAAGFASPEDRGVRIAPADVSSLVMEIRRISGSTVGVLNQIGLLRAVSRRGQTAHGRIGLDRLDRPLRLVEDALAQLAGELGREPWGLADLGLVSADPRGACERRSHAEPLPSPFVGSLFEWAAPTSACHPLRRSDQDLRFEIQSNPDLDHIDRLRAERRRRLIRAAEDDMSGPMEDRTTVDT